MAKLSQEVQLQLALLQKGDFASLQKRVAALQRREEDKWRRWIVLQANGGAGSPSLLKRQPEYITPKMERQLAWLRSCERLPAWEKVMDHLKLYSGALRSRDRFNQRVWDAAVKYYLKTAFQLRDKLLGLRRVGRPADDGFLAELREAYIACLRETPEKITQEQVVRKMAQAKGRDTEDDSFDEINETRNLRAKLKRRGYEWTGVDPELVLRLAQEN